VGKHVTLLKHIILIQSQQVFVLTPEYCVFSREAANTNLNAFGLTWAMLQPTIYHTWEEHANYYTTDVVCTTKIMHDNTAKCHEKLTTLNSTSTFFLNYNYTFKYHTNPYFAIRLL